MEQEPHLAVSFHPASWGATVPLWAFGWPFTCQVGSDSTDEITSLTCVLALSQAMQLLSPPAGMVALFARSSLPPPRLSWESHSPFGVHYKCYLPMAFFSINHSPPPSSSCPELPDFLSGSFILAPRQVLRSLEVIQLFSEYTTCF